MQQQRKSRVQLNRKFVGATQKKKIKQATKSKTNRLASNDLLRPSKMTEEKGLPGPNSICHSIGFGH
jgi:hypothetical protein